MNVMLHPIVTIGLKTNDWTRTFVTGSASIARYGIVNLNYRNICGWRLIQHLTREADVSL